MSCLSVCLVKSIDDVIDPRELYATLDPSLIHRSEIIPNKYASLDAITYCRSVFMKAGIWLFNTTVQYHMHEVDAYIKLDLNPYDVTLEWMEFIWSSYLYNERNLRHVTIVLNVNSPRGDDVKDIWFSIQLKISLQLIHGRYGPHWSERQRKKE